MKEKFDSVNKALIDACQLALKQPIPGKQLVLTTDSSFRSAGYALLIENNPDQKIQPKRKTYAPMAFGSKISSPAQLNGNKLKRFFGNLRGSSWVCTHSLGSNKANNCSDDNKSVIRFFQAKTIPPALWNVCVYVMQFSFRKTRNCQNNDCLQGKILFSKNGAINQGVGHVMWAMHQTIKNWS